MIEVRNLCKDYHIVNKAPGIKGAIKGLIRHEEEMLHAVSNLNFNVDGGEIVGFIGPNGAGKSTTIKMMSGILNPSSGAVYIDGRDISRNRKEVVKNIGVVFGQRTQLNWDLRLGETFELLRHIYQIDKSKYNDTLDVMDEILGIREIIDKPVRQMSLGQRMKGDLVAAMIHSPSVLFLDEPTIGLDVSTKYALRKFIKDINKVRNTTIVLTTHDLGDIEELCERLIIINHGRLVEDGNLKDIIDRIAPYKTLCVEYYNTNAPEYDKCELVEHTDNVAKYRFQKSEVTAAQIIAALSEQNKIKDISIEEAGIDDIIRIAYNVPEDLHATATNRGRL